MNHISVRGSHPTHKGLEKLEIPQPKPASEEPDIYFLRENRDIKQASKAVFYITVLPHSH